MTASFFSFSSSARVGRILVLTLLSLFLLLLAASIYTLGWVAGSWGQGSRPNELGQANESFLFFQLDPVA